MSPILSKERSVWLLAPRFITSRSFGRVKSRRSQLVRISIVAPKEPPSEENRSRFKGSIRVDSVNLQAKDRELEDERFQDGSKEN